MMLAVILAALLAVPLLGLVTFVQLLYLESMRLRTRDLPSLKFFKDTLEDKLGMKTEDGAGDRFRSSSTRCWCSSASSTWPGARTAIRGTRPVSGRLSLAAWLTMVAVSYALPQVLYRRTTGRWLLPLVPLLRGLALLARPMRGARCPSSSRSSTWPTTRPATKKSPPPPKTSKP